MSTMCTVSNVLCKIWRMLVIRRKSNLTPKAITSIILRLFSSSPFSSSLIHVSFFSHTNNKNYASATTYRERKTTWLNARCFFAILSESDIFLSLRFSTFKNRHLAESDANITQAKYFLVVTCLPNTVSSVK